MVKVSMRGGQDASNLYQQEGWFGAPLDSILVFGGAANWSDWQTSTQWTANNFAGTGKDLMWSIPLIPTGANLADAAAGQYDANYVAQAKQLLANAGSDSQIYIRLGWEFNGAGWNAWSAVGQPQNYIGAFQNAVDAFRSVSDKFRFEWTPSVGNVGMNPEDAYPGDQYVDVIGMDFYWDINKSGFTDPTAAFNYMVTQQYGLQWHQDFAAAHNKPTAYAEWGINSNNAGPYIQLADQWFESHNVLYQNYWNSNSAFQGKLSDNQYPDAGAAYKAAFTGDAGSGAVVVGAHASWIGTSADDSYTVTRLGDVIVEAAGGGVDTVYTAMNYTLPVNVEKLVLTGAGDQNGAGNASANTITGTASNNLLRGLAGNDRLIGGAGADTLDGGVGVDTMDGGAGNDVYLVDNSSDQIIEGALAADGYDLVSSGVSYVLPINVEELDLTGTAAINATGNALANLISGNGAANQLFGMDGNDTLNGDAGADTMTGGNGNDRYIVDNVGDSIVEASGGGTDIVLSSVNFTLGNEVENLQLTGAYNMNGYGNALANAITGNGANNTLYGYAGNDTLAGGAGADFLNGGDGTDLIDGGTGSDTMTGGNGNDLYIVDSSGDSISESYSGGAGGVDSVQSSIGYTLGYMVENLTLTGAANINGNGNDQANVLTGNSGANALYGLNGNDTLNGGAGADKLYGGAGNDQFVFKPGEANGDLIGDFAGNGAAAGDSILLQGYGAGAYATIGSGALTIHYSGGLEVISLGVSPIDASDFSFG